MTLVVLNLISILAMVFFTPMVVLGLLAADPRIAPWTVFTYPFVNLSDPIGYAFMIIWLWWIGTYLESYWGWRKFLLAWLGFGVLHDLVFLLCSGHGLTGLFILDSTLTLCWTILNAGAVIRLMLMFPVTAVVFRYITMLAIFVSAGLQGGPIAGVAAVVVALAAGYWTVVAPGRSILPLRFQRNTQPRKSKSKAKLIVVPSAEAPKVTSLPDPPAVPTPLEQDIDRILDKIRLEGMASLTSEEKNLLDEHSSRLRSRG